MDASLSVGEVKTLVTVEGTAATQVGTESSEVSGVVTGKQISQIVLNGRNFTQLITLTPGVSNQTGQDEGTVGVYGSVGFTVNGGRTEYNNWEIDGGDNMDNGSNGTLNVYPNVDAIAEVRVLTSKYGAQYGRNGSGTVETVTKSGTKEFHGNLAEFVRNDAFNARNFLLRTRLPIRRTITATPSAVRCGFPACITRKKRKHSSSGSQEWRKERLPNTYNIQVPSTQQRQGLFNDVCPAAGSAVNSEAYPDCPVHPVTGAYYPNNMVPIDPNAQAIMAMVPGPTSGSGAESFYNDSVATPTNWREELVRIDHNFSDTQRFFFRYIHDSWDTVTPTSLWSGDVFPTVGTNFVGPGVSLVAHMANNISPPSVSGVVNGKTVTGQTAQDLAVACGASPADPYRKYTGYSTITLIEPQANSIYNAMQVSMRRTAVPCSHWPTPGAIRSTTRRTATTATSSTLTTWAARDRAPISTRRTS